MDSRWLCTKFCLTVCLCAVNFCKQDISKNNLRIFVKFVAEAPNVLCWKWLILVQIILKMAGYEWFKICSFYIGQFLGSIGGAL